jgi:hypothetical protein
LFVVAIVIVEPNCTGNSYIPYSTRSTLKISSYLPVIFSSFCGNGPATGFAHSPLATTIIKNINTKMKNEKNWTKNL